MDGTGGGLGVLKAAVLATSVEEFCSSVPAAMWGIRKYTCSYDDYILNILAKYLPEFYVIILYSSPHANAKTQFHLSLGYSRSQWSHFCNCSLTFREKDTNILKNGTYHATKTFHKIRSLTVSKKGLRYDQQQPKYNNLTAQLLQKVTTESRIQWISLRPQVTVRFCGKL